MIGASLPCLEFDLVGVCDFGETMGDEGPREWRCGVCGSWAFDVSSSMLMLMSSSAGVNTVDGTATEGPKGGLRNSFSSSSEESAGVSVGV